MATPIPYLQVEHLRKSVGDKLLFSDLSFGVNKSDKIALVARNGIGKSTLMNIIAGLMDYDSGILTWRKDLKYHYLPQDLPIIEGEETLSGGQRKWYAIERVLADDPDMLILDEPTNHLDLKHVERLEGILSKSSTTLLMVTHDRYFLDRVCNQILEIDEHHLYRYEGNYSYYLEKRAARLEAQQKETQRARNLYRTELDWMRRMPQARGHKAKYRISNFYALEQTAHRSVNNDQVRLEVEAEYIGNKIFEAKHLNKTFASDSMHHEHVILRDFSYVFARYEKLGIIGENGTGKSTFLRILLGEQQVDSGVLEVGTTVRFGYYSQAGLPEMCGKKVIDVVREVSETIPMGNGDQLTASQFLEHFLFTPQQQYDYVDKLSGGERRRLYLCLVLMANPNFLVLDEPTNDLDIPTLQVLESYLQRFKGCVIVVSHDRFFMDRVVDHLFVFRGEGEIEDFPGNYTQFRAAEKESVVVSEKQKPLSSTNRPLQDRPRRLTYKEKQEIAKLETRMPQWETELKEIEKQLSRAEDDAEKIAVAAQRYKTVQELLDAAELRWLELSEIVK